MAKRKKDKRDTGVKRMVEEALRTIERATKDDPRAIAAAKAGARKAEIAARSLAKRGGRPIKVAGADCPGSTCSFACGVGCAAGCLIGGGTTIAFGALGGTVGGSGTAIVLS